MLITFNIFDRLTLKDGTWMIQPEQKYHWSLIIVKPIVWV